jgi:dihydroorotase
MLLIKNATIYSGLADAAPVQGAVEVEGDRIRRVLTDPAEIAAAEAAAADVVDARGRWLLPGVVDPHVHFREPGMTAKGDIASESRAAAAGGVTTVLDMPNVRPTTTTPEALAEKAALFAERCVVNYGLFFGITSDNIDTALALPAESFCGYKVFLGSSTGGMLMNDERLLRRLFESTDRVIAVHSESEEVIRRNAERYRAEYGDAEVPVALHPLIRSAEACRATTEPIVRLARETGAQLHVCHVTTARELELFTPEYPNITAEACVAHLWFTDADYARLGARIKCNPAVKTEADRAALRRGLTDGRITLVATDHAPHLLSEKEGGALKAASGIPSLQYSLVAMLELARQGVCSVADVVRLMCRKPAERYGLSDRGVIEAGRRADLILVDPAGETAATPADIRSKCGWSPFEGVTFHSRVVGTWVNGKRVYEHA